MKKQPKILYYLIIFLLTCLIFFLIRLLVAYPFFNNIREAIINIVVPFLISFIIVYIFHPLLYYLERKLAIKTTISTTIIITIIILFFIALVNFLIPYLGHQIISIVNDIPNIEDKLSQFIQSNEFLNNPSISVEIENIKNQIYARLDARFVSFMITNTIGLFLRLWVIMIIPIIIFMMTKDYGLFYDKIEQIVNKYKKSEYMKLLYNINQKLGAYIRGQLIIMSYMFVGTYLLLLIIGMPNALLFSIIIAVTNIIPYLGPYIGGIPLAIYGYFQSFDLLIGSLIVILVMQQLDGNIGQPLVFGKQLNIHPLVVMAVMLIGSALAGVIGLIASVPIYIILSEVIKFIKIQRKNKKYELDVK